MIKSLRIAVIAAVALVVASCGGEPTRQEFVDKGIELDTAERTSESETERLYGCVFDELEGDSETIEAFMDLDDLQDVDDDLSEKVSVALLACQGYDSDE